MSEKCPKCGLVSPPVSDIALQMGYGHAPDGVECLRRQLAAVTAERDRLKEAQQDCIILRQALYYMAGRLLDAQGRGPSTYSSLSTWQKGLHRTVAWLLRAAFKDMRFRAKIERQMGWRFEEIKRGFRKHGGKGQEEN